VLKYGKPGLIYTPILFTFNENFTFIGKN